MNKLLFAALLFASPEVGSAQSLIVIGDTQSQGTVIEAFGSTKLVQVGSNFFFYPVGGSSGPALSYGGAPFVAGQFGGWTPIGVEQTASGYEVAWKVTGADQYTVWNTDSSGNYTSNAIGTVPGSSVAAFEPSFHQDLNGDGVIGPPPTGILPPDRQTLWQPGVTYNTSGIPDRTDIYMTLSPSGGDDTAAIQAALDGCPPGTVVQLTAGVFNITGNGLHVKARFAHIKRVRPLMGIGPGFRIPIKRNCGKGIGTGLLDRRRGLVSAERNRCQMARR